MAYIKDSHNTGQTQTGIKPKAPSSTYDAYKAYAEKRMKDEAAAKKLYGKDYTTGHTAGTAGSTYKPPTNTPSSSGSYNNTTNTGGASGNAGGAYSDYYSKALEAAEEQMRARQRAANESANAAKDNLQSAYRTSLGSANTYTDDELRQAYIRNQQLTKSLEGQSAMTGYGGASETSMMGVQAGYGNERNSLEQGRQQAISQLEAQRLAGISDIESNRAQGSLAANTDYQQMLYDAALREMQQKKDGGGGSGTSESSGGGASNENESAKLSPIKMQRANMWIEKADENQSKNKYVSSQAQLDEIISVLQRVYMSGYLDQDEVAYIAGHYGINPQFK